MPPASASTDRRRKAAPSGYGRECRANNRERHRTHPRLARLVEFGFPWSRANPRKSSGPEHLVQTIDTENAVRRVGRLVLAGTIPDETGRVRALAKGFLRPLRPAGWGQENGQLESRCPHPMRRPNVPTLQLWFGVVHQKRQSF